MNVTATVNTGLCPAELDSRSESFLNLPSAATAAAYAAARSTFILLADLSECTRLTPENARTVYMPLSDYLWEVVAYQNEICGNMYRRQSDTAG